MTTSDSTIDILRRHLDADFIVHPLAPHAPSLAEVRALAQRLGVVFPSEFEAHVTGQFPGIHVEVKEAIWPAAKPYEVGPFWKFLKGVRTYSACEQSEDWMRIDTAAAEVLASTGVAAAPVLRLNGDPNIFCVTADGTLAQLDHDTLTLEPVEVGFFELFERELKALCERKTRYKEEFPRS